VADFDFDSDLDARHTATGRPRKASTARVDAGAQVTPRSEEPANPLLAAGETTGYARLAIARASQLVRQSDDRRVLPVADALHGIECQLAILHVDWHDRR
jgi:hypothetical protein